jgi:hypothetical protein
MSSVRKRVLVTGGAGFLGSHLCERLIAGGDDVLCVDNYFIGRKENVAALLPLPQFEAMRHDITHPLFVEVDEIYNLACPASPIHYQFDPVQTTKTSVIGAINMLGLAKRLKARIFQASTSEVYGDANVHPQPESYRGNVNPIGPRACYDDPGTQHAPDRIRRPEGAELGRRSVFHAGQRTLVKRDVAMRVDEAGQDELARGINHRVVRGLRPYRAVRFADTSDAVSVDDEEPVRDRVTA